MSSALKTAEASMDAASGQVTNVGIGDLSQVAGEASDALNLIFTDEELERALSDRGLHPLRELRGLDKALQTIQGNLVHDVAMIKVLDDNILAAIIERTEMEDGADKEAITERIRTLEDERSTRLEAASVGRDELRSNIARIRQSLARMLNSDKTLAERVRTLFREQGVTIASLLTALGMAITALVLAIVPGGSAPAAVPATPAVPAKPSWVKKQLAALARLLKMLAGKAASSLPGIVGALLSWVLKMAGAAIGWLGSNIWALGIGIGALLLWTVQVNMSPKPPQSG